MRCPIINSLRGPWPRRPMWRIGRNDRPLLWRRCCPCMSAGAAGRRQRRCMAVRRVSRRVCSRESPSWIKLSENGSATPKRPPVARPGNKNTPTNASFPSYNPDLASIIPTKSASFVRSCRWHAHRAEWWMLVTVGSRVERGTTRLPRGRSIERVRNSFRRCRRMWRGWSVVMVVTVMVERRRRGRGSRRDILAVFIDCNAAGIVVKCCYSLREIPWGGTTGIK
mmetsp:Transcript_1247/g.2222  ORF Transcript_1247/g.2222 Transcript_1247/m.2222 type:complete len:224 (-) Transcript_1247:29-700(-)